MNNGNQSSQPGPIQRFLWWLTGATTHILAMCPTDHRKYSAIGVTMLIIPSMAAFSAGFAVRQAFDSAAAALGVAALWFMLVFNVDRLLLISIRKREGGGIKEFLMALPRLVMVILLSILITEPLLHKLFEGEIANQLTAETQQSADQARQAATGIYGQEIRAIDEENKRLTAELEGMRKERDQKHKELMEEGEGTGGTRRPGKGTFYAEKKAAYELAAREYEVTKGAADEATARNDARRSELIGKVDTSVYQAAVSKGNAKGFLAKHSALMTIVRRDPSAGFLYFTLSLALILLESTPLTIKLFSKRGHYDQLLERYEQERIHQEKKAQEENISRIDVEHEVRVESTAIVQRLKKEKLERIAERVLNGDLSGLSGDDSEVAALLMSTVKREVLGDLAPATSAEAADEVPAHEPRPSRPAPLLIHIHEPEEEFFTVNFNRPESAVKGGDLLYALQGLGDLLPPSAVRPALSDYQLKSDGGRLIDADLDLFPQLGGSRVVHLTLDAQPGSDATN